MKKPPHAATRDGSMLLNTQQKSLYGCSRERLKNTAMSEKRKDYFSGGENIPQVCIVERPGGSAHLLGGIHRLTSSRQ
jgi:hypothetical protein